MIHIAQDIRMEVPSGGHFMYRRESLTSLENIVLHEERRQEPGICNHLDAVLEFLGRQFVLARSGLVVARRDPDNYRYSPKWWLYDYY